MENFPSHPLLDYALQVEQVTTAKVNHIYSKGSLMNA